MKKRYRNINRNDFSIACIIMSVATLLYMSISPSQDASTKQSVKFAKHKLQPSEQMVQSIRKYSKKYRVPEDYLYAVAFHETGFRGPKHGKYNPAQKSKAGALGAMQIMPTTANYIHKKKVSKQRLLTDVDFNVMTSAKLIRQLKDKYKDWPTVFGCYNTGKPIVNDYALSVVNKDYTWDKN